MQNNDYISREAASKAITELMSSPWATEGMFFRGVHDALSLVCDMMLGNVPEGMKIPNADVIPVSYMEEQIDRGKWREIIQRWREHNE